MRLPSRTIIATIIRVPPAHMDERPADKAVHHRAPISIGMTMAAGSNRRTSVPPTLAADKQRRDPASGARTDHAKRKQTQGDRRLQRDVRVGDGGLENEIEQADDRGDSRHSRQDLGGRIPARSPRDRPVQPKQCEPQQEKIQGGDRRHQAWTKTANRVRGGFLEQQLVDPQVPAGHMLDQAQQAHHRGESRQQLAAELAAAGDRAIVHFPHQPQRETESTPDRRRR